MNDANKVSWTNGKNDIDTTEFKTGTLHLPRWQDLPDKELTNCELVKYINSILCCFPGRIRPNTTTMVQNYVKVQLLPRPEGKRYDRRHLAWGLAISLLKKVLTIHEISKYVRLQMEIAPLANAYNMFIDQLESAGKYVFSPTVIEEETVCFPAYQVNRSAAVLCNICHAIALKLMAEIFLTEEDFAAFYLNSSPRKEITK